MAKYLQTDFSLESLKFSNKRSPIMNLLQQDPKKVTVITLLLQRVAMTFLVVGLSGVAAAATANPELFGGAFIAQALYLGATTLKDIFNSKIPNN